MLIVQEVKQLQKNTFQMSKIYISRIKESWVVDNFRKDFLNYYSDLTTKYVSRSNTIWIIAPWLFKSISKKQLINKNVLCSFYHLDENNQNDINLFKELEPFVTEFHTISEKSKKNLQKFTDKKINQIPFWVDTEKFYFIEDKTSLRKDLGFKEKDFLIGSFQRDSEGSDVSKPKLIKGPDIFIEIISKLNMKHSNLKVVLTGKRRNYIINELEKRNIDFVYFEMVDFELLNKLYNSLNLYIVSSRLEGGPQAIAECATTLTPILSTNVGVAPQILSSSSIFEYSNFQSFFDSKPDVETAKLNVKEYETPNGIEKFKDMLCSLNES